ncbi:MAG: Crp/Fnr family transcriptional regulator [Cyanobacteria bacterium P01_A01_bin.37]
MVHSFVSETASQSDLRQVLENLYEGRLLRPYMSGQSIPMEPQEIWIVCRGVVQLGTLYATGDEALLGLACPSMPFGLPLTSIRPYQASALTNVDLMRLSISEIESSPVLAQSIFRHMGRRLQQTEAILAMVGYRRVEERLRHLLLLLQQEVGQPDDQGTRLGVRLTHQQLANTIGTTRVTVTRLLNQLKDEGWLLIDRQRHIVLTPNASSSYTS